VKEEIRAGAQEGNQEEIREEITRDHEEIRRVTGPTGV
jgi:hypothetical protein